MSGNYRQHPERYPCVDPNFDAAREARIANHVAAAMAERERMMAHCRCEWDEGSYFWNPDCPEHSEPEGASDEEWQRRFASYRYGQERKARDREARILLLFRGIHRLENVVHAVAAGRRWSRIGGEDARARYAVLYRLRGEIEDEILAIAREV